MVVLSLHLPASPHIYTIQHCRRQLQCRPRISCFCETPNGKTISNINKMVQLSTSRSYNPDNEKEEEIKTECCSLLTTLFALAPLLCPEGALAVDGQFGILEGRSFALVHPIVMATLFAYTLWAGYLGWQWRQVRTIQSELNDLKKQVKPHKEGDPPSELELKVEKLTETRKELIKGGYRDRHFNAGSILLAFGVTEAVGGCVNTWFRTGKLFPGPHLFAGAGITVLWAFAAALVPAMQKGNETARNLHITLNVLNVVLFAWQIPTGLEIVLKVFQFVPWP